MRKAIGWVIGIMVLVPVIAVIRPYLPKAVTFERVEQAYNDAGFWVTEVTRVEPPTLDSVAQLSLRVEGYPVNVYQFDSEGPIAKQLEFQKPDAGSVVVEAWNLSERLGAAKPKNIPTSAARNGMFMLTVQSEDAGLRRRVVEIFKGL